MRSSSKTIIVVGGGIIGLSTGLNLLKQNPDVRIILIEKENDVAQHQTGHNSGVIHSGLYYKPGSLKAINCRNGYRQLLEFCESESIPYDICGKLVIATDSNELPGLAELYKRGKANGLVGLKYLAAKEIREIEPHCSGIQALHVPEAGIVNYEHIAKAYLGKLKKLGAEIIYNQRVDTIKRQSNGMMEVSSPSSAWQAHAVVICAGLHADRLALKTMPDLPLRILPFRGEYFTLKPEYNYFVNHLIYPVPDPELPFLGVHFTRMIGGGVECGPNAVFAFGREAYNKLDFSLRDTWDAITWPGFGLVAKKYWRTGLSEFHRSLSKQAFVRSLKKLIPEIEADHLNPCDSGIRAQACDINGRLLDDFDIRIDGRAIYVCNAPSPAATSSLAIGQKISSLVFEQINQ